jgi:hypothetical protein
VSVVSRWLDRTRSHQNGIPAQVWKHGDSAADARGIKVFAKLPGVGFEACQARTVNQHELEGFRKTASAQGRRLEIKRLIRRLGQHVNESINKGQVRLPAIHDVVIGNHRGTVEQAATQCAASIESFDVFSPRHDDESDLPSSTPL